MQAQWLLHRSEPLEELIRCLESRSVSTLESKRDDGRDMGAETAAKQRSMNVTCPSLNPANCALEMSIGCGERALCVRGEGWWLGMLTSIGRKSNETENGRELFVSVCD